ncbi:non-ribosomal peptide synthetase/type I polyketide synthase [Cylindrospermum sp. FACHB-282]|uniref:non-ribosomal peptide synthetase/type I polyketide synthase n=1 Tax=Cylindrospermum sp. FACHB-282 TaxID=2692794 RepID=UPI00168840E8|nr:non-ribosomal peptide synthetase/type I polyketide synthase [Cylindrospermum sp. FACHB-282]MBD2385061.1 amino acid adenylation domain-containing protein [Cylindrospermum sp. FACHB-282]
MSGASDNVKNLSSLQRSVLLIEKLESKVNRLEYSKTEPIAIIGMSCRFPGGANNPQSFWTILREGVDAVTEVPPNRWNIEDYYDENPHSPGKIYTKSGGFLSDIDQFDPHFFGISSREAVSIDPQHRLLLEVTWEALENAGHIPQRNQGSPTGVFVGITLNDYGSIAKQARSDISLEAYGVTGSPSYAAAGRISYTFGFTGPCMAIDTACSSSLVAIHQACQSLRQQECQMALAGGVNLILLPDSMIATAKANMLSSDGRCKTFDAGADGIGRGEGCGILLLKRLSTAQADGDRILAVIRGSAVNQDGPSSGLTVPNGSSQQQVMSQALKMAKVEPSEVSYVEAHGTGTPLGDPIELRSLGKIYGAKRSQEQPLFVGSAKTNISHVETAAGVAGVIKVILQLQHQQIVPHLHLKTPTTHFNWQEFSLIVPTKVTPWNVQSGKRLGVVNSFGATGTNAHIVLEEAPEPLKNSNSGLLERSHHLLTLGGKTEKALKDLVERYHSWMEVSADLDIADLCYTANTGRAHFQHRLALLISDPQELGEKLRSLTLRLSQGESIAETTSIPGVFQGQLPSNSRSPKVAFLFTGQGSQYVDMGRQLYETQPLFRQTIEQCDKILRSLLAQPLLEVLYPQNADKSQARGAADLDQTDYTQPALFALEYALAQLWISWGIKPTVVMGHSVGEYVAACIAGVFSLEDGLKLIAARSRLMQSLPQNGAMVVVFADEARVIEAIANYRDTVAIAAYNGPQNIVISGEKQAIATIKAALEADEIDIRPLNTSHAFHSPLVDPILDQLEQLAREISTHPPRIPMISNLTGQILSANQPLDGQYWRNHSREAVRFMAGVSTLVEQGYETFLEIGPKPILSKLGHKCQLGENLLWLSSLHQGQPAWPILLNSLAQLYVRGADVNWSGFDQDYSRQRLILPTYPFQRQRYWFETPNADMPPQKSTEPADEPISDLSQQREQILRKLQSLIGQTLQISPNEVDIHTPLVEMGADSIVFMETGQKLETLFAVRIPIRKLFEDLSTLDALGTYIADHLPEGFEFAESTELDSRIHDSDVNESTSNKSFSPEQVAPTTRETENGYSQPSQTSNSIAPNQVATTALERIMSQQLQAMSDLMSQQLAILRRETALTEPQQFIPTNPVSTPPSLPVTNPITQPSPVNLSQPGGKESKRQEFWERREFKPKLSDLQDPSANFKVTVPANKEMQFSLYYFGSYDAEFTTDKYGLLFAGAKYADQNGFTAVWVPERHFHAFGGFSPNPSILSAALAAVTKHINLRAGSVVLPIHHPVRVAEDWAVIDNISQGRVGISFASGWHPHDFVFAPEAYEERREIMFEGIETVQKLWRGESIQLPSGSGQLAEIRTFPMPRQKELPIWVTIVNNPDTYIRAGAMGVGVLTNLMGQTVDDLARNIALYRESLARHGYDSTVGQVTVLLHTFVGADIQQVREQARQPFQNYLTSSIGLFQALVKSQGLEVTDFEKMTEDDKEYILSAAYHRYVQTSALIGTPDSCIEIVERLLAIGVDEIACLIDFGVDQSAVVDSLPYLKTLKERVNQVKTADWLYTLDWQQQPRDISAVLPQEPGHWLIFADEQGVGTALAEQIRSDGQTCALIYPQGGVTPVPKKAQEIDPTDPEAFKQFLQDQISASELPIKGIIHLWSLDSPLSTQLTVDLLHKTQEILCGSVLHLVQAVAQNPELTDAGTKVWLITQQAVMPENAAPTGIAQASLWGFGRVIALEHSEFWGALIDIDAKGKAAELSAQLWLEITERKRKGEQAEDQVLLHQEKRYVARLVRHAIASNSHSHAALNLDLDGTCLITGGLGALGIRLAQWLVDQGVRHLVLCGRSAPSLKIQQTITELQQQGIQVMVAQVDVSNSTDLAELLQQIQGKTPENWPPLHGIFHLAGLLDDGVLFQQTWQRFDAVMAPKILGTWNLHILTQELPIKHFVLFSSIASLLGSPGQSNHAAANAFIDALAHYRRANGLPAVSLNWGSWTEIGKVTRLEGQQQQRWKDYFEKLWRSYGMEAIAPNAGFHALGQLLNQPPVQVGVFPIDWPKFCQSLGVQQKPLLLDLTQPVVPVSSPLSSSTKIEPVETSITPLRIPLSEAQKQLWLLAQIVEAGSVVYNDNVNLELRGDLQLEVLKQAVQTVVDRHEALRTVIDPQGEWQEILPTFAIDIPLVDLSSQICGKKKEEQDQQLLDWLTQRSQEPLNLSKSPLFQIEVLKLEQKRHVLVITIHHIISDGWSIENILKEIGLIYSALCDGAAVTLETPLQFREFLNWQTKRSQSSEMLSHESFWVEQFASSIPVLELPTDRTRPVRKTYHGNRQTYETDPRLREQLRQFSQGQGCTLFMTLLAAHFVLLHRLSRQEEIVLGIPTAGRFLSGSETMVGYATHLLPIRSCFHEELTFQAYLAEIRERLLDAYEHQDYPFAQLLNRLNLKSDSSRTPLVSVTFNLEPPVPTAPLKNLETALVSRPISFTHFDLHFIVIDLGDRLILEAKYNTDLFNDATIKRWLSHFQTLLQGIMAQPDQSVGTLPLLTQQERLQMLVQWNTGSPDYPQQGLLSAENLHNTCIHQLFQKQVLKTPNTVAVVFEDQQLTYHELNAKSNQLAHHLRNLKTKSGSRVVLYTGRSLETLIGMLGILKAGGAYIPVDAGTTPPSRLALLLEDIQPTAILTQDPFIQNLPTRDSTPFPVVLLDKEWSAIAENSAENSTFQVTPDDLAYMIFTSGSTGKPKGVAIEHRHLVAYTTSITQRLDLQPGMSFATVSTFAADLGYTAIFPTLCTGGILHIIAQERATDPSALAAYFSQHQIDCLKIVPAHLNALLDGEQSPQVLPRHTLVLGGDTLSWDLAEKIQSLAPHCRIFNHYGPSEATVGVVASIVKQQSERLSATVPLGRPLRHAQVYILDRQMQPVPIGVPGEIYIGGASVAQGYLDQPELTAEKFIPSPFQNSERLYKTGDLARYLPDGNIEFLGRIDHQVKIRGYRLEVGEVESVFGKHPGVQQAVILARVEEQSGDKRLVAYWVPVQTESADVPSPHELRQFLLEQLPDYMVPSALIKLESIPLTANGKVDRQALPVPEQDLSQDVDFIPPRTPTEQAIADIFATILQLESVGINNNFFELGGHSLLATQVISRLRETFQIDLPLISLFESPTVAGLDLIIHQQMQRGIGQIAPPITAVPRTSDLRLPLSWSQERLWFLDQLEGASATYNMPAAVHLHGDLNADALEQALAEIVQRHEVLRTGFQSDDGGAIQVVLPEARLRLHSIDLQLMPVSEQETTVQQQIIKEAQTPFDLSQAPLMRATLLHISPQDHILLVTMHHIVSDGWSVSLVVRELSTLYQAFAQNQPSPLADLSIQYADFALWQRQWLTGDVLQTQLSYWQNQLAGNLPILQLPLDDPLPDRQDYRGAQQNISISRSLTQGLKALSHQEGVTLFMTLFAAFNVLLSRHTGQEDIIVGSPIAGRNLMGCEDLIGFFINTLPLRTNLADNPSFRQLLTRVREVTLGAYTHQDIPFEKLVEELRPERVLHRHPLFDVLFNFVNTPAAVLGMGDLTFEPLVQPESYAKFWLTFYIRPVGEALNIELVYRQNLFTSERMTALLEQFVFLLEQVVNHPDNTIQTYSLLSPQSAALLPNPTIPLLKPDYELVSTSFANWAKKTPEQTAIRQHSRTWTYGELALAAQGIAQVLISDGLQQQDVVALCGNRTFGLIASILGIFLGKAVLVTLDPNLPPQRQRLILDQTQAQYLITIGNQSLSPEVLKDGLKIISVAPDTGRIADVDILAVPLPSLAPTDPAYIFFTSGSTGTPKGVLGTHQGIAHFIHWQRKTFEIKPDDRVAQLIGLSFDALLRDIFLPLTSGATLCLPDQDYIPGSPQILSWLEKEKISVFHTVPAVAQSWLQQVPEKVTLSYLRWAFFSGEPLTHTLVNQWRQSFPAAGNIVNLYGATETTMVKCFYPVPPQIPAGVLPGGFPLPDTQVLILNGNNQVCGIGELGEIVVRTPFCTLGYISEPDSSSGNSVALNHAVEQVPSPFVLNPFRQDMQDWVYYTGDRGRYRPDGAVEVLGRLDDQIKIRGIRVQPGEIEAMLNQYPAIAEGVVIAKQKTSGEHYLVAYIVVKSGQSVTHQELQKFLKRQLPEYMIPFSFVELDALPLTATGKVNRKILPEPINSTNQPYEHREPRTPTEIKIVDTFKQVLHLDQVGIDDNFFELGGHSLLAAQVISRLQPEFQVNIPLKSLFETPTPTELAALVDKLQLEKGAESILPKITKISRKRHQAKVSAEGELAISEELKHEILKPNQ